MKDKLLVNIYNAGDIKRITSVGKVYYTCDGCYHINKETLCSRDNWKIQYRFANDEGGKIYNKIQITNALNKYEDSIDNLCNSIRKLEILLSDCRYVEFNDEDLLHDINDTLISLQEDLKELQKYEN